MSGGCDRERTDEEREIERLRAALRIQLAATGEATRERDRAIAERDTALARVDVLQKRERRMFDGFRAEIDRIQEALGIGPTRSVLWCVAEIGRLRRWVDPSDLRRACALLDIRSDIMFATLMRVTRERLEGVKADDSATGNTKGPVLSMILAVARNGVIGHGGKIPWDLSEDRRHFRAITMGHTLIVGRKTAEGLPRLMGRTLTVVSLGLSDAARSIGEAIQRAFATDPEPIVIGGAEVYRAALPLVTRIYLTEIDADYEGDTVFHLDRSGFVETDRRAGETPGVTFVTLERR